MKLSKLKVKNFKSIKDSGEIQFTDGLFVLAGQNESGKSSLLEALNVFENGEANRENLNFELENQENYIQEISCTFKNINNETIELFSKKIFELIKIISNNAIDDDINKYISIENLSKINEITISRVFDFSKNESLIQFINIDLLTYNIIKKSINKAEYDEIDEIGNLNKVKIPYLNLEEYLGEISGILFDLKPQIILFNDFSSLLPDKISLDNLNNPEIEGYQAVKNLENLISKKFSLIAIKEARQIKSATEDESKIISANFQGDWQQRIFGNNSVNIKFDILHNVHGKQEIIFSVETKDNEYLAPRRRSKGMIWFLSLWLELKAKENGENLILIFDEPGLHLHIKANRNMLKVFHKLVEKGHQIIYSTHSPSLIEAENLHNIGLVINDIKKGTTVEGLTTSKLNSENKRDALQPIAEAMGLEPLKDFTLLNQKNVLLEGLSDFWILKGFEILLGKKLDYAFIPCVGIKGSKINPLISFCIGYGFDWLLVMDGGELPKKLREELKNDLFAGNDEETNSKIYLISEDEIENLFDVADIPKIDNSYKVDFSKKPIEIIGKKKKIIFSRLFYYKVQNGSLKKSNFNTSTLNEFEKIFEWIEYQFKK